MSNFFLVGNWKSYGSTKKIAKFLSEYTSLLKDSKSSCFSSVQKILALPHAYLNLTSQIRKSFAACQFELGAQSVSSFSEGPYTGEVNARMLNDLSVSFAIVGHYERKIFQRESEEDVLKQIYSLHEQNIPAILCFGDENEGDPKESAMKIFKNLHKILLTVPKSYRDLMLFAYEPYWAIGGKKAASAHYLNIFFKDLSEKIYQYFDFSPKLLYGGSVNKNSIFDILKFQVPVSGVLVGNASLDASSFFELNKIISMRK